MAPPVLSPVRLCGLQPHRSPSEYPSRLVVPLPRICGQSECDIGLLPAPHNRRNVGKERSPASCCRSLVAECCVRCCRPLSLSGSCPGKEISLVFPPSGRIANKMVPLVHLRQYE